MVKTILCILSLIIVAYLIWVFRNSDSEFIPFEDMNDKE